MVRYLSPEWVAAIDAAVAPVATTPTSLVAQVDIESVSYHLVAKAGRARVRFGPHGSPDVVLSQSRDVAIGVASGRRNAQEAFIAGEIRLTGNADALIAARELFEALDLALTSVRLMTEF